MKTIHAVYEHGVFRPLETVDLAEQTEVEFEPRPIQRRTFRQIRISTPSILFYPERYQSGACDTAARHNEHQP